MATANVRKMVVISLFIALQIVFTRLFSISLPIVRIGFGFLPLALTSIMFGPLYGAIAASIADVLGHILYPTGPFFPGFVLTAGISGTIYGKFLYKKQKSYKNIVLSVVLASFNRLVLNSIWLYIIMGPAILAQLPIRLINTLVMVPIEIYMILFFWKFIISKVDWN